MLVDGAVRFAEVSKQAMEDKDIKKCHENIIKTQNIFTELMVSLDQNAGEWAVQMFKIYEFIKEKLVEANIKKDIKIMDEIIPLIEDIRDTWHEASKVSKNQR